MIFAKRAHMCSNLFYSMDFLSSFKELFFHLKLIKAIIHNFLTQIPIQVKDKFQLGLDALQPEPNLL